MLLSNDSASRKIVSPLHPEQAAEVHAHELNFNDVGLYCAFIYKPNFDVAEQIITGKIASLST